MAAAKTKFTSSTDAQLDKLAKLLTSSKGIPDFRSPVTGLYASLAKYNLPYPEALFDINYFRENPQAFYTFYKELYPDGTRYKPTLVHCFYKLLEDKGKLLRVFTQNSMFYSHTVDTLEMLAGLSPKLLVEAHGSFAKARCVECKTVVEEDWLKDKVKKGEIARCEQEKCRKKKARPAIKPDITFFGENLPDRFFKHLSDFSKAQVNPFASLIDEVPTDCPRYLLNLDRVGEKASKSYLSVFGYDNSSGFDFSENSRDKFCQGKVDDMVRSLARKCGWEVSVRSNTKGELDALYEQTHKEITARNESSVNSEEKRAKPSESTALPLLNETEELAEQLSSTHLAARTDSLKKK